MPPLSIFGKTIEHLWEKRTADMCKFGANIERNVRSRFATTPEPKLYAGPYRDDLLVCSCVNAKWD